MTRQFQYHVGAVTDEHEESGKLKSTATTQLVSRITFADNRTLDYEYDAEERITSVVETYKVNEQTFTNTTLYTYDALGQLLTETVNDTLVNVMTYDNYGNILTKNGIAYTYQQEGWKDLLIQVGEGENNTITYDAQGNPTSYLGHTLTWEKGRQLKSFDSNTYTYNANGIRTSKTVAGVKHDYILDGTKILREAWNYDEVTKTYQDILIPLYDNEDSVCGIIYNGEPYYFQKNLQGDVISIVDKNGEPVARYSYDAWGANAGIITCTELTDGVDIANINPFRYRGYYFDKEIGMYYLQSRYYDPEICRFISSDDYIYSQASIFGKNLFAYCDNDAVNRLDTLGHWWFVIAVIVAVSIVVCGCTKKEQQVKRVIKYNVPLYDQGNYRLCWAYCQVMVESYQKGEKLRKKKADARAKEIAIARHGSTDWNKGGWPSNLGSDRDVNTIETLYNILLANGPVYGFYVGPSGSHLIVITGVNVNKNRVFTNNPWGSKGKQSFDEFKKGVAKKASQSGQGLVFKRVYLVKKV